MTRLQTTVRSLGAVAAVAALSLGAAACGDDSGSSDTAAATTAAAGATTLAPSDSTSGPVVIEVDADAAEPATATVPLGASVKIVVTSATSQEFHLHGYDIEQEGTDVTFEFTADQAGDFELESHATEKVILNLTVEG